MNSVGTKLQWYVRFNFVVGIETTKRVLAGRLNIISYINSFNHTVYINKLSYTKSAWACKNPNIWEHNSFALNTDTSTQQRRILRHKLCYSGRKMQSQGRQLPSVLLLAQASDECKKNHSHTKLDRSTVARLPVQS